MFLSTVTLLMEALNSVMLSSSSRVVCRPDLLLKLRRYSAIIILVGIFFWIWALLNTLTGKVPFDLGLVSFALIILTGVFGVAGSQQQWTHMKARRYRALVYISHGFLCINYLLGVVIGHARLGFAIYCASFVVIWFVLMVIVGKMAAEYETSLESS